MPLLCALHPTKTTLNFQYNNMLKFAILVSIGIIILYALFSFVELTLNPLAWSLISRILSSLVVLSWMYIVEKYGNTWD